MAKFKVGDWVKDPDWDAGKIIRINKQGLHIVFLSIAPEFLSQSNPQVCSLIVEKEENLIKLKPKFNCLSELFEEVQDD